MYTKHIPVKVFCVKQLFQHTVICKRGLWNKEYSREMCSVLEVLGLRLKTSQKSPFPMQFLLCI